MIHFRKLPTQQYYNTSEIMQPKAKGKKEPHKSVSDTSSINAYSTEALYNSSTTLEVVPSETNHGDNPLYHEEQKTKTAKTPPKHNPALALQLAMRKQGELPPGTTSIQNDNFFSRFAPCTVCGSSALCNHRGNPTAGAKRQPESVIYDDTTITQLPADANPRQSDIYENNSRSRGAGGLNIQGRLSKLFGRNQPKPIEERRVSEFQYDYIDPSALGISKIK